MTQKENHTDIKTGGGANIGSNVDANQFTGRDHINVAGDYNVVQSVFEKYFLRFKDEQQFC